MKQLALDIGLSSRPSLERFFAGPNDAALSHLRLWTRGGTRAPVPTYLWGESGSGKTHLLQAVLGEVVARGWGGISLGATQCQMWDAWAPGWPTLAVIDDCDQLPAEHQHLAFNLFVQAAEARADATEGPLYILAAGRLAAADLPVRDDLRTRLAWGLSFALHPLDDAGVREALKLEAARRGLTLGDELLHHLLTRFSRNLGLLMALLDQLDDYALAQHRSPTVPLLKQMLALETP